MSFTSVSLESHVDFGLRYRYTGGNIPRKVRVIPLDLFSGDKNGNMSKKWNKSDSWSMVPAALPLELGKCKVESDCGSGGP